MSSLKFAKTEVFRFVYRGFKILIQIFQNFDFRRSEVILSLIYHFTRVT